MFINQKIKKLIDNYFGYKEEDTGEIAKARVDELDDILSAPIGSKSGADSQIKITRSPYASDLTGDGIAKELPKKPKPVPPPQPAAPPPPQPQPEAPPPPP